MTPARLDTLVFGGGVAGLWTLRVLVDAGVDAWLVETNGLGAAQSMQAQGIVHGGGKYALRRVGDVEAIRHIREMPERWRAHRAGLRSPSLVDARTSSDCCWLWLPAGSWRARLEAATLIPFLRHGGVLSAVPRSCARAEWPAPLRDHAYRAYRMDEPVLEPVSVIRALSDPVGRRILKIDPIDGDAIERASDGFTVRFTGGEIHARQLVACAGEGNADILRAAGHDPDLMQRRPLRMGLIRGALPALHGHCVAGGRTQATITSVDLTDGRRVWQVGGELAERWASTTDERFFGALVAEIERLLPGMDLSAMEVGDYPAMRAEAANEQLRRPSGVQVEVLEKGFLVCWPTKWAMAPLLAEEVAQIVVPGAREGDASESLAEWPRATLGTPPWERATWRSVNSAAPA